MEQNVGSEEIKKGLYRHYKGKQYEVVGEARHSETMEKLVVYRAMYGNYGLWVRPKEMFEEMVVQDGRILPRFEYMGDQ